MPVIASPTARWTAEHLGMLRQAPCHLIPLVDGTALQHPLPGFDLWDLWPLQLADGNTAVVDGWTLWFVLSAPAGEDPEARHDIVRIRLMAERGGAWRDHGNALPDELNPGSREWAGSSLYDLETGAVTLYWTASGLRGEQPRTFTQRMFETTGNLTGSADHFGIEGWTAPREIAGGPIPHYMLVTAAEGVPGFIKGFRDPAHFRDPADGADYLLFTGSLKDAKSAWNGCIGLLRREGDGWAVLPPLLSADGLNNEQERPHVVFHAGHYYLFWSTQRKVFAPGVPSGPNGLYGMVAERMEGPWLPLNGSGLVAGNPEEAPVQTYSWWVTQDLTVHGFVDYPNSRKGNDHGDAAWRRAHFAGVPAPVFCLALDGTRAEVAA
jgi:levansucrase